MHPILRNILAAAAGILAGMALNEGIIISSAYLVPPPEGADMMTPEGIEAAMPLLQPKHFLMPFLAHALGTFAGAYLSSLLSANNKMRIALSIGGIFLSGGLMAAYMIPAPIWFVAADLMLAYLPMAYLAGRIAFKE